jgi:hydroxymethylpyrimidine pyrophosphatase-like HAD family hydrolase
MSKRKTLAIDLDGTLLENKFPQLGKPNPDLVRVLQAVRAVGWRIVIWTVRADSPELREHLDRYGVPYDDVNFNPGGPSNGSGKIYADVYLDDRALNFSGDTQGLASQIINFKPWYQRKSWMKFEDLPKK